VTLATHLHVVGALLLLLGASHIFFNRYFGWEQELQTVSLLTRRIFFVHTSSLGLEWRWPAQGRCSTPTLSSATTL
jgi:hypothetical protein